MASVTAREVDWKLIYCLESLVLPDCFIVSLIPFVAHSMNFTKEQRVSSLLTFELAVNEREKASMQAGEGEGTP